MRSRSTSRGTRTGIDKLDFDQNRRPRSADGDTDDEGPSGLLADDESLLGDVVEGVIERDRRKMARLVTKYASFICAILAWFVFLKDQDQTALDYCHKAHDADLWVVSVQDQSLLFHFTALSSCRTCGIPNSKSMQSPPLPKLPCTSQSRCSDFS